MVQATADYWVIAGAVVVLVAALAIWLWPRRSDEK
jgi:hypothetical protein